MREGLDSTGAFGVTVEPETPDPDPDAPDAEPEPEAPDPDPELVVGLDEWGVALPGIALATAAERTPPATIAPMAK